MSHSERIEVEKSNSLSIPEILADFFLKKIDMPTHSDDSDHKHKSKRKKSKHKKRKHKKSKHRHRSSSGSDSSSKISALNTKDVVDEEMGIKRLKKIKSMKLQSVSDTVLQSSITLSAESEVKNKSIQSSSSNENLVFYGPSLELLFSGVEKNCLNLKPKASENDLCPDEQKTSDHLLSKTDCSTGSMQEGSSIKVQDIAPSSDSFASLQTGKTSVISNEVDNIHNSNNTVNESKHINENDVKQNDSKKDMKQNDSKEDVKQTNSQGDMKQNDSKSDINLSHFENHVKNESENSIKENNCKNHNKGNDSNENTQISFSKDRLNDSKTETLYKNDDKKECKKSNKGRDSAIDEKLKNDSDHKTENSSITSKSKKKTNSKKKHSRSRSKSRSHTKHTSLKSKRERSRSKDSYSKKKKRQHSRSRSHEKARSYERKVKSHSRSRSRSRYRRSRRNSRSRSPYERYSRRKSRSRSRSYTRSRKRSKSKTRKHSRSRERYRSLSKSKHRTKSSKKSVSHSKSRSRSRTRHTSPSKEKSRSKSKERKSTSQKSTKIDQAKILATARKNVLKMMKNGTLPEGLPVENLKKEQLISIQAGGKSVQELTDFCQRLSQKENEPDASEKEENDDNADDENGFIHHPFKVKEPAMIKLNIKNAVQLPIRTHAQKVAETARLSSQFPVSSGNQHKQKELEWVPVVSESSKTVTKPTEKTVTTTAEIKNTAVAVPEIPVSPIPPPLAPPVTVAYACPPSTEIATIEPPISIPPPVTIIPPPVTIVPPPVVMPCVPPPLPPPPPLPIEEPVLCTTFYQMPAQPVMQTYVTPNQQMVVPFSTVSTPVPSTSVFKPPKRLDISSIVTKRFQALTKLQENPNDSEALRTLQEAQESIQEWVQSQQVPGLFTGSTDAKVLSVAELCGPFKYHKNRKDILSHAPPVTEGKGMSLLKKMGWNPGEGLGKNKEGSLEPLVLDIKMDKKGLVSEGENSKKGVSSFVKELQGKHPVSALMELCSKRRWKPPLYSCVLDHGPPHKKLFNFKVEVNGVEYQPVNPCSNKKVAKADAAVLCLQSLNVLPKSA